MPEETAPFRPLDAAHVRAALADSLFRRRPLQARTGSTNDDATPLLARADAAGTTLVAEEQTAGRGRKAGRSWIAPAGSGLLVHDDSAGIDAAPPTCGRCRSGWRCAWPTASMHACGAARRPALAERLLRAAAAKSRGSCAFRASPGDTAHVGCGVGHQRAAARPRARSRASNRRRHSSATSRRDVSREVVLAEVLPRSNGGSARAARARRRRAHL